MDTEYIVSKLPLQPGPEHLGNVLSVDDGAFDEIQKQFCFFKRESMIVNEDNFTEAFGFTDKEMKTAYGARCRCSACREEFAAGYVNSKRGNDAGIILTEGEDGLLYAGYTTADGINAAVFREGATIICPFCGETLTVRKFADLSHDGELFALRTQEIVTIERYAAVMTWEWRRYIFADGRQGDETVPVSALVIDEDGKLRCFFLINDVWEEEIDPGFFDALQILYVDCDSINDYKIGGICDPYPPDLTGTTGEKTGLADFVSGEGRNPAVYLMSWYERPAIEKLVKSPYGKILIGHFNELINQNIEYNLFPTESVTDFDWIDWYRRRPHQMLGLSKEELNELGDYNWATDTYALFDEYNKNFKTSPHEFAEMRKTFGTESLRRLSTLLQKESFKPSLCRVLNYLKRQKLYSVRGLEYYLDYINVAGTDDEELIFPKSLETAHERIASIAKIKDAKNKIVAFDSVRNKYKELEFSDGELCIILPQSPLDLVKEGEVLRHCVGGYVEKHAEGESIIFFVRHSRRPERSYYTLNISFGKGEPREVQLHGYGNERHGEHKEHEHKISYKVRAFVDRWKSEVLLPWHRRQIKSALKENKVKTA